MLVPPPRRRLPAPPRWVLPPQLRRQLRHRRRRHPPPSPASRRRVPLSTGVHPLPPRSTRPPRHGARPRPDRAPEADDRPRLRRRSRRGGPLALAAGRASRPVAVGVHPSAPAPAAPSRPHREGLPDRPRVARSLHRRAWVDAARLRDPVRRGAEAVPPEAVVPRGPAPVAPAGTGVPVRAVAMAGAAPEVGLDAARCRRPRRAEADRAAVGGRPSVAPVDVVATWRSSSRPS